MRGLGKQDISCDSCASSYITDSVLCRVKIAWLVGDPRGRVLLVRRIPSCGSRCCSGGSGPRIIACARQIIAMAVRTASMVVVVARWVVVGGGNSSSTRGKQGKGKALHLCLSLSYGRFKFERAVLSCGF